MNGCFWSCRSQIRRINERKKKQTKSILDQFECETLTWSWNNALINTTEKWILASRKVFNCFIRAYSLFQQFYVMGRRHRRLVVVVVFFSVFIHRKYTINTYLRDKQWQYCPFFFYSSYRSSTMLNCLCFVRYYYYFFSLVLLCMLVIFQDFICLF